MSEGEGMAVVGGTFWGGGRNTGNDCRLRWLCCDGEKGDVTGRVGTVFDVDR